MGGSEQHPTCPLSARFISSSAALGRSASASGLSPVSAASSEKQESTQSGVKWQRQVPLVEQNGNGSSPLCAVTSADSRPAAPT